MIWWCSAFGISWCAARPGARGCTGSLPGQMQAGIVIERSSAGLRPITGCSAPARKLCRQRVMRAMKSAASIAISASRAFGLMPMTSLQ